MYKIFESQINTKQSKDTKFMEDIMNEINNLLELKSVKEALEKENSFNLFKVCNIEYKELIHSAIIAELLNPKGSHGKGDKLLKKFLKYVGSCDVDISSNDIKVETEASIDNGRIDILISGSGINKPIVIENKIWASDQEKQLKRYYEDIDKKYKTKPVILYLTLYGNMPSAYSLGCEKHDVQSKLDEYNIKCISYKKCIRNWLKSINCENNKQLSYTLSLYKETLEEIFHMEDNDNIFEEIINKNLFDAFDKIRTINPKEIVLRKICNELRKDEEWSSSLETYSNGFHINDKKYNIGYGFDSNPSQENLWPGFCSDDINNIDDELKNKIKDGFARLIRNDENKYYGGIKTYDSWFYTIAMKESMVTLYADGIKNGKNDFIEWIKTMLKEMKGILANKD